MPAWLVEGSPTVYFLLVCTAIIFLAFWWRTGKRQWLAGAAVVGVLILGVFLLDRLIESDGEQIERKLQEMAAGVTGQDFDRVFQNISDSFQVNGVTKSGFRTFAEGHARSWNVTSLRIWDVNPKAISRGQRRAEVEFHFRVLTNLTPGMEFFLARTIFVLDSDDQWRLQSFQVFNPYADAKQPMPIPGWGG